MKPGEKKIWQMITASDRMLSFSDLRDATGLSDKELVEGLQSFLKIGFIVRDIDTGLYRLPYAMKSRELYAQDYGKKDLGVSDLYPYVDWDRLDLLSRSKEIQARAQDATSAGYVFGEFLKSKSTGLERSQAFMDIWESSVYQLYGFIKFLLDIIVSTDFDEVEGKEKFHRNVLEIFKTNMDEYFFPVLQGLVYFVFKNSDLMDDEFRSWWERLELKV
jgi:hypothetical protein